MLFRKYWLRTGPTKKISELPFFDYEKNLLDIFKARGLSNYTESQLRPHELAKSAIEKTLAKNFCLPELIDCIVLATDSFWDEAIYSRSQFNIIMNDLGLKNAYPIGVFMLECTSSSVALQIASNLIFCKKASNVLQASRYTHEKFWPSCPQNLFASRDLYWALIRPASATHWPILGCAQWLPP